MDQSLGIRNGFRINPKPKPLNPTPPPAALDAVFVEELRSGSDRAVEFVDEAPVLWSSVLSL